MNASMKPRKTSPAPLPTLLTVAVALGAAVLVAGLPAPPAARASLVEAMDLAALTAAARRIVVGEVLSVSSAWDAGRTRIYTTTVVQIAETWKGERTATGQIRIVQLGGSVGDIEMRVHGLASFQPGERAVLFLDTFSDGRGTNFVPVGLGQGKRLMRFDGQARRWMVDGGDRSAAVHLGARGELRPAPVEAPLPLDDLRSRVRKLVGR